jgi:hypothetical protein
MNPKDADNIKKNLLKLKDSFKAIEGLNGSLQSIIKAEGKLTNEETEKLNAAAEKMEALKDLKDQTIGKYGHFSN